MKPAPGPVPFLEDEQVFEIAEILRLMGEPSRLRILIACLTEPGPVGEMADRVGMPRSLVSHHLRMLRASRLLRSKKRGKQVIYSAYDERVRCIVEDLSNHILAAPRALEAGPNDAKRTREERPIRGKRRARAA